MKPATAQTLAIRRHEPKDRAHPAELGCGTPRPGGTARRVAARRFHEKNGRAEVGRGTVGPFRCPYHERKTCG